MIELLRSGKKLRLKEGFDPSFSDIHLGHMVSLRKLRQFQELGHQVVLIVADWTAQIGDPSGVSVTRPMLSVEQVMANAETYMPSPRLFSLPASLLLLSYWLGMISVPAIMMDDRLP